MLCDRFKEGLALLAQNQTAPEAAEHVAECPDCAWRLVQMKRIVSMLWEPVVNEPEESCRLRLVARLIGGGRGRAGARRSEVSEFALHVGVDGVSFHLAYAPTGEGWEVLGRAPDADWSVVHAGGEVPCGASGRFRLLARDLDGTMFTLRNADLEIDVPSAREMIDFGA